MKSQNVYDERLAPYFIFIFILLASPKKTKQTDKQTNRKNVGRDTATAVANYTAGPDTNLKKIIISPH